MNKVAVIVSCSNEHHFLQSDVFVKLTFSPYLSLFRVQNKVSSSMHAKLAAYSLALLLHLGHMTADLTLLHRDLGITEAR